MNRKEKLQAVRRIILTLLHRGKSYEEALMAELVEGCVFTYEDPLGNRVTAHLDAERFLELNGSSIIYRSPTGVTIYPNVHIIGRPITMKLIDQAVKGLDIGFLEVENQHYNWAEFRSYFFSAFKNRKGGPITIDDHAEAMIDRLLLFLRFAEKDLKSKIKI